LPWDDETRDRWRRAVKELRAAEEAYRALPLNAFGHLEIGVSPEAEAWERRKRAEEAYGAFRDALPPLQSSAESPAAKEAHVRGQTAGRTVRGANGGRFHRGWRRTGRGDQVNRRKELVDLD
jgi:hypothetical protein